jgi:hypothetical protein
MRWFLRIGNWGSWQCENCHSTLRFSPHRRLATAMVSSLLSSLVFLAATACLLTGVAAWKWAPWLLLAYFGGSVLIMRHRDRIVSSGEVTDSDLKKMCENIRQNRLAGKSAPLSTP